MPLFEEYIESFLAFHEPWWVYLLAFLLPLSVLLCVREIWCWFFKLNKVVNRLERLERTLERIAEQGTLAADEPKLRADEEVRRGPSEL